MMIATTTARDAAALAWQASERLPIERLDDVSRAKLLALLAALMLLLVLLVAFILAAGRLARRYAASPSHQRRDTSSELRRDDWAEKPLYPADALDEPANGPPPDEPDPPCS